MALTKTLGPLHFEDLDPHRFEDLVRDLAYDFRDWQTIEALGRVGGDEGFDARAREKSLHSDSTETIEEQGEEVGENLSPMDGNVWMIQCKREKELGPKRLVEIINEGVVGEIPYGYVLAAPVNFSKKAQDAFRDTLRAKGVMEFYLWGKGELEDMLLQPKNDRLLFAFFGISLATRRRSISTKIRSSIISKNRITKALTSTPSTHDFNESVLVRDLHDSTYPYKTDSNKPGWREYVVYTYHPLGLMTHVHEYYGYIDRERKEFDFIDKLDLVRRQEDRNGYDEEKHEQRRKIEDMWDFLPRENQVHFVIDGLIAFEDMQIVDDKGDCYYQIPHIFVDFTQHDGPFKGVLEKFTAGSMEPESLSRDYKRIKYFPVKFPEIRKKKLHSDRVITLDQETSRLLKSVYNHANTLFSLDERYDFLNIGDGVPVSGSTKDDELIAQVTHRYTISVSSYLAKSRSLHSRSEIERQVGRQVSDDDTLVVLEVRRAYRWGFNE